MKRAVKMAGLTSLLLLLGLAVSCKSRESERSGGVSADPGVPITDLHGHLDLAQYKGKVVLVDFWATWCEPCRKEIPWLIEMQRKYASRGFTVLGVSMDEDGRSAVVPFLQKERFDVQGRKEAINYPIALGNDQVADQFGGLIGFPTSVLISRDGKVVKKSIGLVNYEELARAVEGQL